MIAIFLDRLHGLTPKHCLPQVRQYLTDASFYARDVKTRRLCKNYYNYQKGDHSSSFRCGSFSPSAATVKVGSRVGFRVQLPKTVGF